MRNAILVLLMLISTLSYSQFELGIKTGLSSTDLVQNSIFINNGDSNYDLSVADAKYGFHFGLYSRISVASFYIEPAFLFNSTSVDYTIDEQIFDTEIISTIRTETYNNLDIPLMIGMKLGFFRIQGGPVAHIFLNSASELTKIPDYSQKFKDAAYGAQFGLGLDIFKIRLDVNYEMNLSKYGDHINVGDSEYSFDERPGRLIASLGLRF